MIKGTFSRSTPGAIELLSAPDMANTDVSWKPLPPTLNEMALLKAA